MPKIAIHAFSQVHESQKEELPKRLAAVAEASRKEEGNLHYSPTINMEDQTKFHVYEVYESIDALKAHAASEHFKALQQWLQTKDLLVAPFTIEKHILVADSA